MAKLIISSKGKILQEVELTKTVVIGRETGDIMIKNPAISARHASIEKQGDQFIAKDLGSTNGTYLNDETITSHALSDGDVLIIGKYSFRFEDPKEEDPFAVNNDDGFDDMAGRTMVMDTAKIKAIMGDHHKGSAPDSTTKVRVDEPKQKAAKLFLTTSSGPQLFKLAKSVTLIGAGDNADVQIKGFTVGSVAASITQLGDEEFEVAYQGGMAKLKVKGVSVEKHLLKNGESFTIGSYSFEFRID